VESQRKISLTLRPQGSSLKVLSFAGVAFAPAEKVAQILPLLEARYGEVTTELHHRSPYELTVAVVLSAQCTDVRVNQTTPAFFERFPDFESLAKADVGEVLSHIRSISYPNSKAQRLVSLAQQVMERFGGELPKDPETLATLPGIGRKSANVISSVLYEAPVIAVDTHVFRVSRRLGLAKGNTPEKVEAELTAIIPAAYLGRAHHWLILFGRYHCTARRPKCEACPFTALCEWYRLQEGHSFTIENTEQAEQPSQAKASKGLKAKSASAVGSKSKRAPKQQPSQGIPAKNPTRRKS